LPSFLIEKILLTHLDIYLFIPTCEIVELKQIFVEKKVSSSALFTFLVRWHTSAVSLPQGDVILAQLAKLPNLKLKTRPKPLLGFLLSLSPDRYQNEVPRCFSKLIGFTNKINYFFKYSMIAALVMQVQFLWLPQKCPTIAANNILRCCLALIAELQLDPPLFLPFSARSYDTPPNAIWPNTNSTKTLRDIYETYFEWNIMKYFYTLVFPESAQSCFILYIWSIAIGRLSFGESSEHLQQWHHLRPLL
jgi:hypothetical protein